MFSNLARKARAIVRMSALRQAVFQAAFFVFLLTISGFAALQTIESQFERRIEAELLARFDVIAEDISINGFDQDAYPFTQFERVLLLEDHGLLETGFDVDLIEEAEQPFERDFGRGQWVYFSDNIEEGQLIVGTNLGRRDDFIEVLGSTFVFIGLAAAAFALLLGLVMGLRTQRRLNRIKGTLADVAKGDLEARTHNASNRDDLDDLAHQVDDTITQLDALMRQTRDFSASIAHDLKTPLARLRIRLETALGAELDSGQSAEQIGAALEQADRVIGIFDAFLRIAKLEAGSAKGQFEPLALAEVAREVEELYRPFVEDAGHEFEVQIDGATMLQADRVLLIQMLANLIENAVRHTPAGARITLIASRNELGVADTGPGIPADEYENVTRPLYRLDKSRSGTGAGLGLSLAKTIANLHGAALILSPADMTSKSGLYVRAQFAPDGHFTQM